jgi:hypothetical protein
MATGRGQVEDRSRAGRRKSLSQSARHTHNPPTASLAMLRCSRVLVASVLRVVIAQSTLDMANLSLLPPTGPLTHNGKPALCHSHLRPNNVLGIRAHIVDNWPVLKSRVCFAGVRHCAFLPLLRRIRSVGVALSRQSRSLRSCASSVGSDPMPSPSRRMTKPAVL